MASARSDVRRRREDLIRHAGGGATPTEVFARASSRLRSLVPFDAAAWLGTDPGTGLPTSPVRIEHVEGVSHAMCSEHWRHELLGDDVNLFRTLARADTPVASMRATIEEPERSRRYRRFLQPLGFQDELRAVLRVGDAPWGTVTLWRGHGSPPFGPDDNALVAGLAAPLGEVLRCHARPSDQLEGTLAHGRPGLLLFDHDGNLVSISDEARQWLDELPAEPGLATDHAVQVPVWMMITALRAGAAYHGLGDGTARTRVRTQRGQWLVCHASCLRHPGGDPANTAVVIEPAQPAAVAPIVVEAFELTEREQQIVQLVARGAGTSEIASDLLLSPHTVRDHIKAIFAKAGVSSRGELTAKLFADFYEPLHSHSVARGRTP